MPKARAITIRHVLDPKTHQGSSGLGQRRRRANRAPPRLRASIILPLGKGVIVKEEAQERQDKANEVQEMGVEKEARVRSHSRKCLT